MNKKNSADISERERTKRWRQIGGVEEQINKKQSIKL